MKLKKRIVRIVFFGLFMTLSLARIGNFAGPGQAESGELGEGLYVSEAVIPVISPAVRDLRPGASPAEPVVGVPSRQNPGLDSLVPGVHLDGDVHTRALDPLISTAREAAGLTPGLDFSFGGIGNPAACGSCAPPDAVGDVGPNHYVQMVNATKFAIYDKTGGLLVGPTDFGLLWPVGNCGTNLGGPIVLYDSMADRWLLSQYASPSHVCIAISITSDPTGAYWLYEFNALAFPDYLKFGVWPDGYYMGANESTYTAYVFDRQQMILGNPASFQKKTGGTNFYLPSDLDGATPPPAGSPNYFYTFKDNTFHGGPDRIEVWEFDVDFATPANTTFTLADSLPVTAFSYTVCGFFVFDCVAQMGTTQKVDVVSEWPMFRFPYRNFGSHEALAGAFTVGGGLGEAGAAIRWFELRKTSGGWSLYQEGTHDPGDGHDRFMPSIAIDGGGNIALGYSVSSSAMHPAIRYATRWVNDPPGALQLEASLIEGGGSQTGSNRWGDYSAMSVDPASDCSFWYTNEYYAADSPNQWSTRVGIFSLPACSVPGINLPIVTRN